MSVDPADLIADWRGSPWREFATPWALTHGAERAVADLLPRLGEEFRVSDGVSIHCTATVEHGAVLKAPCVVGRDCFVAHNAYMRGGVWLADKVIVGPSCEVKSSFFFAGSKVAHLSFVGDSVVGSEANIEAGAMVANYRNEFDDKLISFDFDGRTIETGVEKFGCAIGDRARVGANAVIAPGAILKAGEIVPRLCLVDRSPRDN